MTYGPAIECNGKRPEWLGGDEVIWLCHRSEGGWHTKYKVLAISAWHPISCFALPADHPYYRATAAGFKYWPGGEIAPDDWDGGMVLFRSGNMSDSSNSGLGWNWDAMKSAHSIIGYHPKPEATEGGAFQSEGTAPEAAWQPTPLPKLAALEGFEMRSAKDFLRCEIATHEMMLAKYRAALDALNAIEGDA